MLTLSTS